MLLGDFGGEEGQQLIELRTLKATLRRHQTRFGKLIGQIRRDDDGLREDVLVRSVQLQCWHIEKRVDLREVLTVRGSPVPDVEVHQFQIQA
ncbi:hypothetical protein D9M71_812970 [compost metagenome]